ncbi:imidazolonepropionase-like amidohydrolase [Sphingopyxis panaciterrae]|uniref:amidohydrolase family protein n=1 Tax=Sphingopyxis panaciterrae TaxID=363841 RepID=UPI0014223161|nr:amidohydrolase family protein [Sphingopyxis panaciterrae]NIJ38715.1 imidazolonepropionase-like amidohydrolase [Sphingopyxis panaciterrae]
MKIAALLSGLLLATAVIAAPAAAQDGGPEARPIYNRDQWLPKSVPTSDDVLRIPMPADYNAPKGSFVLVGGRLFDGTGKPARPATVVVQGKSITAVLNPGDKNWPADAVVYDVTGKTVMPGLIDLHSHLTFMEGADAASVYSTANMSGAESVMRGVKRMGVYLESGVTSVRDVASHGDAPFVLKRLQATGELPGPRIMAAGQLITQTGGHGALHTFQPGYPEIHDQNPNSMVRVASGPDQWREAVRIQFAKGADLIKLASEYSQAEITAAVDEAHSLGLPVTVDSETQYIDMAIKAGVDSIEHPLPRSDAAVALMAKRGIASVPTLVAYRVIMRGSGGYFGSTSRRFELNEAVNENMVAKMRRAGVKMGIGLDVVALAGTDFLPGSYIDELESFHRIGFTKAEALVAATKTGAEIMHMGDRLGTIEAGKLADIIVVDGNPDEDFAALRKVQTAFVNGRLMLQDGRIYKAAHEEVPMPAVK